VLFLSLRHCYTGGTLWHLQMHLQYILNSPSIIPFILSPPLLEQLQQASLFHFHLGVHNTSTVFTALHPFLVSSPPMAPTPDRNCFTFLLSVCEKRHFCLFKVAIQRVSS
jgi:hypothetical protein